MLICKPEGTVPAPASQRPPSRAPAQSTDPCGVSLAPEHLSASRRHLQCSQRLCDVGVIPPVQQVRKLKPRPARRRTARVPGVGTQRGQTGPVGTVASTPTKLRPQVRTGASCAPAVTEVRMEAVGMEPGGAATVVNVWAQPSLPGMCGPHTPSTPTHRSSGQRSSGPLPVETRHSVAPAWAAPMCCAWKGAVSSCCVEQPGTGLANKCESLHAVRSLRHSVSTRQPTPVQHGGRCA